MKAFFKSLKKLSWSVLCLALFSLLLTGCPGSAGGNKPKPEPNPIDNPDPDPVPAELNFRTESVGMTFCSLNWNWDEKAHSYKRIAYSLAEDFSDSVKEKKSFDKESLPVVLDYLTPGTNYYIKLEYYDKKAQEDKTAVLTVHTSDKGPLDNLKIKYDNDSKAVKVSYDYIRDATRIKHLKIYRKLENATEWTLIKEGSESDFLESFEDFEYTPNVQNFYKIELYDADGKSLGDDVASVLSITPEDEDAVFDIKVVGRGYSYLDLLWDYSLYDSYKIVHKGTGACDPIEYTSADLTAGKGVHFYFPKNKERAGIVHNISFTIECYKNDALQKTVKRSFEIKNTGAPENLSTELATSNIKLRWNALDKTNDAIAKVYRRTDPSSDYELIGSKKFWFDLYTDEFAEYEDTTYIAGTTNYYKVELYEAVNTECGELFGTAEASCDASSKCSITFDLGEKRKSKDQYVKAYFDKDTDLSTCNDGNPFDDTPSVAVSTDYSDLYEATDTWLYENAVFNFDITLSQNIVLQALYRPKPTSFTKYLSEDTKLYLNWKEKENWSYKLEYGKKDGSLTTVDCGKNTSKTLENLDPGQTYTINLYTIDSENVISNPVTKEITTGPQETEFLLIMYLDGDNNLNNPIYLDMNEVEYGLSTFKTTDHIRVIALWDGYECDNGNNPASSLWGTKTTHIYELGPDPRRKTSAEDLTLLGLADTTFDWTFSANWIENDEVDMSSKTTLQNYLQWVKDHFSGTKTILQFSNHGAGPRSILPNDDRYGRRAMCWDESAEGQTFLKTKDVAEVLANVKLKGETEGMPNKIDLIIEDVCLGSTIEEAYQYKDYAQYFIGSPNTVPGFGLDYDIFIPSMKSGASVLTISKDILKSYKASYALSNAEWASILNQYNALPVFQGANALNAMGISLIYEGACGLTLVDLSKLEDVRTSINDLASKLYLLKEKTISIGDATDINFLDFVRQYTVTPGNPIYYQGSYTWLYDIGAIADTLNSIFKTSEITDQLGLGTGSIPFVLSYILSIEAVKMDLYEAIPASWRDGYQRPSYDTSASKYNTTSTWIGSDIDGNYYGLSICGGTLEVSQSGQEVTVLDGKYPDFYATELQFGQDCENWDNLLKLWFPTD